MKEILLVALLTLTTFAKADQYMRCEATVPGEKPGYEKSYGLDLFFEQAGGGTFKMANFEARPFMHLIPYFADGTLLKRVSAPMETQTYFLMVQGKSIGMFFKEDNRGVFALRLNNEEAVMLNCN